MQASTEQLRSADRWLPLRRLSPRGRGAQVLILHDVLDAEWLTATLHGIGRHARFLDIETFMAHWAEGTLQGDELLLTFDDGFRSIHSVVEPVCAALGIPYVTFVITDVLDGGFAPWPHRLQHLLQSAPADGVAALLNVPTGTARQVLWHAKELSIEPLLRGLSECEARFGVDPAPLVEHYLTREQVAHIHQQGLGTIGLHPHRHPTLSLCTRAEQRAEIITNADILESIVGERPRWFAYPNGTPLDYSATTREVLEDLGLAGAFTTNTGPVAASPDRWHLNRVAMNTGDHYSKFVMRTSLPWFSVEMWREHRARVKSRSPYRSQL